MTPPDFEVNHTGRRGRLCRFARPDELEPICAAIVTDGVLDSYQVERVACTDILILENYISDGPGFAGTMAFVIYGEPCFTTVLGDNGSTNTNWETYKQEL